MTLGGCSSYQIWPFNPFSVLKNILLHHLLSGKKLSKTPCIIQNTLLNYARCFIILLFMIQQFQGKPTWNFKGQKRHRDTSKAVITEMTSMPSSLSWAGCQKVWYNFEKKQAQPGVLHLRVQVELGFILQAGTCQILKGGGGHRTNFLNYFKDSSAVDKVQLKKKLELW